MISRIRLAVEAPLPLMPFLTPRTDLDFALAHRVLESADYAEHFRTRVPDRELILDNSFHELRRPVRIEELLDAADRVNADYIISPDISYKPEWSAAQYHTLREAARGTRFKIGVVLSAHTLAERETFLEEVAGADMLCIPYNQPRFSWYIQSFPAFKRVHLLGACEPAELLAWRPYAEVLNLSIDTSKPIKHGLLGQQLSELRSWRHAPIRSVDLLKLTDITNVPCIYSNLSYLRALLG